MSTIVITGASDGIGLEAASQLAALPQDHHLVLVGRRPEKVAAAVERLHAESPGTPVDAFVADFADLSDVRRLAGELLAAYPRIDVLVNNAGAAFAKRTLTVDGYESTFAVNHLAPFLLTELLLERLVASQARVVITASVGHYQGTMDLDDPGFERGYQIMKAYSRSKLANVLHARELAARLAGTGATAVCLHPGAIATNIWSGAPRFLQPVLAVAKRLAMDTPAQGGAVITRLVTGDDLDAHAGGYFHKDHWQDASELGRDDALARRLVEVSRGLVGLDVPEGSAGQGAGQ